MTNLSQEQMAFSRDVALLILHIYDNGYGVTLGEAYRTQEQALVYWKQGIGIKDSLHTKRLAIDLNLFDSRGNYLTNSKDHQQFGEFWEALSPSNRWGGRFPKRDGNHYERNV